MTILPEAEHSGCRARSLWRQRYRAQITNGIVLYFPPKPVIVFVRPSFYRYLTRTDDGPPWFALVRPKDDFGPHAGSIGSEFR